MDELRHWLGAIAMAISIAGCIYSWLTARAKGNSRHLKQVDENLKSHDRRIQKLENTIEHLPSKDSQHALELAMSEMNGELKAMAANVETLTRTTRRMEAFLMKDD